MYYVALMMLMAFGPAAAGTSGPHCPEAAQAAAAAYRLSDLPDEIRADLNLLAHGEIADSDVPLLQTDTPTGAEARYPTMHFYQAMRFNNLWLVQVEISLTAGVRTISYVSVGGGAFQHVPIHDFGGPPCESIRAAMSGVTTPAAFDR